MLRPSRPMMRPFRSSLGRSTTETVVSMACSAAQRWIASVMYCLARSAAISRASASSRFSRLAESWRASPSICLISSSLASSAVRLATRSSSCCCWATSRSYLAAAASVDCSRVGARPARAPAGPSRAGRSTTCRSISADSRRTQRLLERLRLLPVLARLALGVGQELVRLLLGVEERFLLPGLGVALGVLERCGAPVLRRGRRFRRRCACGWRPRRRTPRRAVDDRDERRRSGTRQSATRVTSFPVTHIGRAQIAAARGLRPRELSELKEGSGAKGPALPCGEVDEPA